MLDVGKEKEVEIRSALAEVCHFLITLNFEGS
jgi:hypothetical protein